MDRLAIDDNPVRPEDVAASACATYVDEWVRAGITEAVVCPGSRSTPMALALAADDRIRVHVHHDERAGSFAALGIALATDRPALVLTTSGTATTHLHAAVVEAHQSSVPLIVVTANRPPELADVASPQTIEQTDLFGSVLRWRDVPGVPDLASRPTWRARAARSVIEARGLGSGGRPGPVHLDLAFREPLVGRPDHVPEGRPDSAPWSVAAPVRRVPDMAALGEVLAGARLGLVVAGAAPGADRGRAAVRLARHLGWPLLLDARLRGDIDSGRDEPSHDRDRHLRGELVVVGTADALLRGDRPVPPPDAVIHVGAPVASRIVNEWIASSGAVEIRIGEGAWTDPYQRAALQIRCSPAEVADAFDRAAPELPDVDPDWARRWAEAERDAQHAIDDQIGDPASSLAPTEPGVARSLLATLEPGSHLVVSSSMPVRDLEWYGRPRSGVTVYSNRGANGIDGVVATAIGVALGSGAPTVCLIGDVALLHDSSALVALAARPVDLTIVVVDNDGGGIFSFLPQAVDPGGERFETLYGTPHGADLTALATSHGLRTAEPATAGDVGPEVRAALAAGGASLVRVRTDRSANVAVHRAIHEAVRIAHP